MKFGKFQGLLVLSLAWAEGLQGQSRGAVWGAGEVRECHTASLEIPNMGTKWLMLDPGS